MFIVDLIGTRGIRSEEEKWPLLSQIAKRRPRHIDQVKSTNCIRLALLSLLVSSWLDVGRPRYVPAARHVHDCCLPPFGTTVFRQLCRHSLDHLTCPHIFPDSPDQCNRWFQHRLGTDCTFQMLNAEREIAESFVTGHVFRTYHDSSLVK